MNVTLDMRLAAREAPAEDKPAMLQRWSRLLFAHWAFEPEVIAATLPRGLALDTFDGKAWVALVPFYMRDVRLTWAPTLPGISNFLELNVRTYVVDAQGRPGVWFYSLDCNQRLAVMLARQFFYLPYQFARMEAIAAPASGDWIDYRCRRQDTARQSRYRYRSLPGEPERAEPGTLEFFLLERYYLVSHHQGRFFRGQVHHTPYRYQAAELETWDLTPFAQAGLPTPTHAPDHLCYVEDVPVKAYKVAEIDA